jgi:hypothetical protein
LFTAVPAGIYFHPVVPTTQARSTPVIGVRARAAHYFF